MPLRAVSLELLMTLTWTINYRNISIAVALIKAMKAEAKKK